MAHNPLRIVHKNFVDSTTTLSVTSQVAGMPVGNLARPQKYKVWRSLANEVTITADFYRETPVSFVGLLHTGVGPGTSVQVKLYAEGETEPYYDSLTTNAFSPMMADEDLLTSSTYMHEGDSAHIVRWVPPGMCKRLELTLEDSAGEYIQAATLLVGPHWEPTVSADLGMTVGVTNLSTNARTDGGSLRSFVKPRFKTLQFSLSALPDDESEEIFNLLTMVGISTPIFVSLFPESDTPAKEYRAQIHGKLKPTAGISQTYFNASKQTVSVESL